VLVDWFNATANEAGPERRVILFGHSWGTSAVVYLARELEQDRVPVALTIQVDSVRKHQSKVFFTAKDKALPLIQPHSGAR
jgi:pimeloyl-ACP methyl ester carboxylesterase